MRDICLLRMGKMYAGAFWYVIFQALIRGVSMLYIESLVVIGAHGIQLETHRGFPPSLVLSASRRFIPMFALQDLVINEGLHGWNVRYYLAAIQRKDSNDYVLQVAYEAGSYDCLL
jgi:phosphatidylinositol glycan class H protein